MEDEELLPLVEQTGFVQSEEVEGYFVAEIDDVVAGYILLRWKGQKAGSKHSRRSFFSLGREYGFFPVTKLFLGLSLLSDEVLTGDLYVDTIAVDSQARGRGIGPMLMAQAEELARSDERFQRLTLYVVSSNDHAIYVYGKAGYRIVKRGRSNLLKLLFGEREWIYMAKPVKPEEHSHASFRKQKYWWLSFIGLAGIVHLVQAFILNTVDFHLLNLLWFGWFSFLIPQKR